MIKAIMGDITKIRNVEAIVNAANKTLLGGTGVDGAIHKAAGIKLHLECMKLHGCKTGEAKITKAYNLPCDYIIHTVGPVWHGGNHNEEQLLASCYINSLELAKSYGIRSVAFPSISTGVYHFPTELAARTAVTAVYDYLKDNPEAFDFVEWVLFDEGTYQVYMDEITGTAGK